MTVRKAVIAAAGVGTRFLPLTKSHPKEMIPLVDKPIIQYAVEEALNSGIEQIVIVTAQGKQAIEDYFDYSFELEYLLEKRGQTKQLQTMRELSALADVSYIRQKRPLGLGHAILTAKGVIGEEPFAVLLPDDVIDSRVPALKQLMKVYEQYKSCTLAVEHVGKEQIAEYGIIKPKRITAGIYQVMSLIEKPEPAQAPSNLGLVGRYILTPEIFDVLKVTPPGKGEEIQLTDALQLLLRQQPIYAAELDGVRYDTGTPLGWLKATVAFALKREDVGPELRKYLQRIL